MTEIQELSLYEAIREAVLEAIDEVGFDVVREMSMFPSSKYNQTNDNDLNLLQKAA